MRRRRRLRDLLWGGSRNLYNLHGIERNTVKSVHGLSYRMNMDAYSGGTFHTRIPEGFRAIGVDNEIWKAHNGNFNHMVNKHFRKIEP